MMKHVFWPSQRPFALILVFLIAATPALAQQKPRTSVIVAAAWEQDLVSRVEALGTTRANEIIRITANVSEKISAIHFTDGQKVSKDDILVELDANEEKAELAAARAVLQESRAAYNRIKKLERQQFAATAQLEERRAAMDEAEARIAVAEARLADRVIRAPFSGRLGLRGISLGALVQAGEEIAILIDDSVMKLDFTVPSEYLRTIHPGLNIEARASAFGDKLFEGTVSSLGNQLDPVTRTITVRAVLPNPESVMLPGLLMTVELLQNPRKALVVPEESVIQRGRNAFVLVVDEAKDNVVERRSISLGARVPGLVEVLDGLKPDELVITHGTIIARPGNPVGIRAIQKPGETLGDIFDRLANGSENSEPKS